MNGIQMADRIKDVEMTDDEALYLVGKAEDQEWINEQRYETEW